MVGHSLPLASNKTTTGNFTLAHGMRKSFGVSRVLLWKTEKLSTTFPRCCLVLSFLLFRPDSDIPLTYRHFRQTNVNHFYGFPFFLSLPNYRTSHAVVMRRQKLLFISSSAEHLTRHAREWVSVTACSRSKNKTIYFSKFKRSVYGEGHF